MSFDFFDAYATDENLENNGTLFPLGKGKLLVARAGNRAYNQALTKAVERRRVELEADESGKVSDEIMAEIMSETILLGWEGDFSYQKKPLPYSISNAKMVLAHRDFRKVVSGLADSMDAFKFKAEAEAGKV